MREESEWSISWREHIFDYLNAHPGIHHSKERIQKPMNCLILVLHRYSIEGTPMKSSQIWQLLRKIRMGGGTAGSSNIRDNRIVRRNQRVLRLKLFPRTPSEDVIDQTAKLSK